MLQCCSAIAIPGQIQAGEDLLFFAEVFGSAFGTTEAAGIVALTSPDKPFLSLNCFPNSH